MSIFTKKIDPVLEHKKNLFEKIGIIIRQNSKILDVGCGNGLDARLVSKRANIVLGIDKSFNKEWIMQKSNLANKLFFSVADAKSLPFKDNNFDFVFAKDVLHHVDNPYEIIKEIKRTTKIGGTIIIIEANRYNPIFYLHMTKMCGHNHLTKGNFMNLITENFSNVEFKFVESHVWPTNNKFITLLLHKIEKILDRILFCRPFLAYNIAIIKI